MDFNRPFSSPLFNRLLSLFCALSLLLGASQATAQDKLPRYKVEVIVFEQLALKGWTEENWPEQLSNIDLSNSTAYLNHNQTPLFIKPTAADLTTVVQRLGKGYRPIFHEAWTQFAYNSRKSPKVSIEQNNASSSLIGTVKIYKTKFSHIELDLELERKIPSQVREALAEKLGMQAIYLPDTWRFKLQEQRKADSGELHYFDHPLFGALVKIDKL